MSAPPPKNWNINAPTVISFITLLLIIGGMLFWIGADYGRHDEKLLNIEKKADSAVKKSDDAMTIAMSDKPGTEPSPTPKPKEKR